MDKSLLELVLGVLIDVLLVVGDDGLGDGLTDGVDLRRVSTTLHAETDVNRREGLLAGDEDGLVDLEAQDLGFEGAGTFLRHVDGTAGRKSGDGERVQAERRSALILVFG